MLYSNFFSKEICSLQYFFPTINTNLYVASIRRTYHGETEQLWSNASNVLENPTKLLWKHLYIVEERNAGLSRISNYILRTNHAFFSRLQIGLSTNKYLHTKFKSLLAGRTEDSSIRVFVQLLFGRTVLGILQKNT